MKRWLGRIRALLEWLHLLPKPISPGAPRAVEAEAAAAALRVASAKTEQAAMKALAADGHLVSANTRVQAYIASVLAEVGYEKGSRPS